MKREESLPGFNVNHIATVVKIMRHQQRMRYVGQWDRVENLEIYPHKCTQLSFHGGIKVINGGNSFSANGAGPTGHPQQKKKKRTLT